MYQINEGGKKWQVKILLLRAVEMHELYTREHRVRWELLTEYHRLVKLLVDFTFS